MTSAYLYGSNRRIAPRKMTKTSLGTTTIKDSKKRIALVQGERDDDSEKDSIIE